ncbi:BQ2448_72 [Microbotryum intermedium]|uniref:BQ2448_72 protein n=1 Tax=Microbotryum intermedium TaxID=269621 RepID=A0A238F7A2_9BASI|nr:BQ2448_72 [Microbotryum intermedium]
MGYEPLPQLGPNDNPFDVYLQVLDREFRRYPLYGPSSGIKQSSKRWGGPGVWFVRRVPVQGGVNLITTNMRAWFCVCGLLQGVAIIMFLVDGWKAYINGGSWRYVFIFRSLLHLPICFLGWIIANGSLQAFIISLRDTETQLRRVHLVNWFFIAGGSIFLYDSRLGSDLEYHRGP